MIRNFRALSIFQGTNFIPHGGLKWPCYVLIFIRWLHQSLKWLTFINQNFSKCHSYPFNTSSEIETPHRPETETQILRVQTYHNKLYSYDIDKADDELRSQDPILIYISDNINRKLANIRLSMCVVCLVMECIQFRQQPKHTAQKYNGLNKSRSFCGFTECLLLHSLDIGQWTRSNHGSSLQCIGYGFGGHLFSLSTLHSHRKGRLLPPNPNFIYFHFIIG